MRALRDRAAGVDRSRLDAVLAIAIMIELELECWLARGVPNSHRPLAAVAVVLLAAPIAVRRRWPAGTLVFATAVATIQALLGGDLSATNGVSIMLAVVLLAYSAGAWLDLRRSVVALIVGIGPLQRVRVRRRREPRGRARIGAVLREPGVRRSVVRRPRCA